MKEFIDKLKKKLYDDRLTCYMTLGDTGNEKYDCAYKYASKIIDGTIQFINQLAEEYGKDTNVTTNGWIPCSERFPETDNYVLCWYEYRIMQGTCEGEMKQTYGIGYYLKPFKNWGGEVSCGRDCKVIAWMPLPAPYTEGE